MKICILGLWHQGIVGAGCLASLGYDVTGADAKAATVETLSKGKAPIFEPGLDDLLQKGVQSGKLRFTTDIAGAVNGCRDVLFMHDTPVNERDESDLSGIFEAARLIAPNLEDDTLIYVTAQVPIGSCDRIADEIRKANPRAKFRIGYSPENLRLGQAIDRFLKPPLPVIGADDPATLDRIEQLLAPMKVKWERVNLRTAEMTKHALNGFLSVSITFANELGNLCDEVGADGKRVAEVLRLEPRVGSKAMLIPGLGFSGGTLARDMQTLRGLGDRFGLETPLLDGTWTSNQQQNATVVRRLQKVFGGSVQGHTVAVLGLTYKPDTSTLRRSAALEVVEELHRLGAVVRTSDPMAERDEQFGNYKHFWNSFSADPVEAAKGAEAVVLMTPWPQYKSIDFAALKAASRAPHLFFDTAGLLPAESLSAQGFVYLDIGRGRKVKT
jgi:UDPglucose 6-dehydrogenase